GVACEVRHERNCAALLAEDAAAVLTLGGEDVLKEHASGVGKMAGSGAQLRLDVFEDEVRRVDLAMRVRVADAHRLALVLEDEHELYVGLRRKLAHLLLPRR